ncbi:MAG TPA: bifunctional DNA-formamidopyrimidine glycosylase/DNA-(apurinic or apyrimidinic site) lyase [Gemmataceae bacterium]|jgi:formamidopyrimidine-DNA glycosylase|nr:bifunctional DNA-formamidopyrimidine glycosylase/DNA-(apurinic or apyrimidinic site) lyase [Gemmataceae bacterium]
MPELPEVETVVRDLRPLLCGQRLIAVHTSRRKLRQPWKRAWQSHVLGKRVEAVRRRGKWIIVDLEQSSHLLVHLGMTGRFTVVESQTPKAAHTHVIFRLNDGERELRFADIRRFGSVRYCANPDELDRLLGSKLGPEPWEMDPNDFYQRLRSSRRCLKAILLDQSVIAGVGNIYADESLFVARLSPKQLGARSTRAQTDRLLRAITEVLNQAIRYRGSSIRDYVGGNGEQGQYQNEFQVYGRAGEPCPNCGRAIACIRLAGRATHFCPRCQRARVAR